MRTSVSDIRRATSGGPAAGALSSVAKVRAAEGMREEERIDIVQLVAAKTLARTARWDESPVKDPVQVRIRRNSSEVMVSGSIKPPLGPHVSALHGSGLSALLLQGRADSC